MSQHLLKLLPALATVIFVGIACSDDPDPDDIGNTPTDTGVRDVGFADSGVDSGTGDSGTSDVGGDGGVNDSGVNDSGSGDAGDGGADTGMTADSGDNDGGPVTDSGPAQDGGPGPTCNPSFGAAQACGGDPRGAWTYVEACSDTDFFAQVRQLCAIITVSNQVVSAGGTLTLSGTSTAGTYARNHTAEVTAAVLVPTACTSNCTALEFALNAVPGYTVSCPAIATGCDCRVARNIVLADNGTWDAVGGVLTANNGAQDFEFNYCAGGGNLTYRGTAANAMDHDFVYLLAP